MKKAGERTTSLVNSVWNGAKGSLNNRTSYSYDNNGNITAICENGKEKVSYGYDSLNRLIKETSGAITTTYNYDRGGNILSKTIVSGGAATENVYEYGTTGNRDRLLKYNGLNFAYDVMGNPTTYKGKALIWEKGRQLKSYDGVTYTYDAFGRRITKTASAVTSQYVYGNNKLLKEAKGATTIEYIYGQGIAGIAVNGVKHVFGTNVQGDVTHIYDISGNLEATYTYDAWGNHTVHNPDGTINTSSTFIGNINPISYRGYYYDTETGLYYLNSRYYDPEIGRFITADDVSLLDLTKGYPNGLNLYVYCFNDPINASDDGGDMPNWLKWLIGGIAFAGAVALTILTGGALAPVFIGMGVSIVAGGVIQGAITAANGGSFWRGFADGAADGALWGGVFALGGAVLRTVKLFTNGITIGENMTRVGKYAKSTGQITYKGMPGYKAVTLFKGENIARKMSIAHNEDFIKRMMKWGVKISDIGLDVTRVNRSWYYFMESILTSGYKGLSIFS